MRTELFISWRYLTTKRKEKFISLISFISILGVAIGVMSLVVVIAVMTGFDRDLRNKIIGNYAHLTISGYQGINSVEYEEIAKKISLRPEIKGMSPFIQAQVITRQRDRFYALNLKGIDPLKESQVSQIKEYLIQGDIGNLVEDCVIVGKELALYLDLGLDSIITVYSSEGRPHNLKVVGIFNSGMYEYDMNLVFINIRTAQEIMGLDNRFTAIAVKLDNVYKADKLKDELLKVLGFNYSINTWIDSNKNFFAALKLEKLTMFIILTLIILVASFNIISTLVVLVVEKTKDIGILKSLGMSSVQIRRIFTYVGILIGILGVSFGALAGILICTLLKKYQFIKLPQDIYYIQYLPVVIDWMDIGIIIASALLISFVSTIYPANKASRLQPVEALRYE
ncbi:MAG: ABC transporter permease [Candidatus Omnitrophica bacterium]|nr:ABC transporter permease [Candidatus Omnitrophota bacterium]